MTAALSRSREFTIFDKITTDRVGDDVLQYRNCRFSVVNDREKLYQLLCSRNSLEPEVFTHGTAMTSEQHGSQKLDLTPYQASSFKQIESTTIATLKLIQATFFAHMW